MVESKIGSDTQNKNVRKQYFSRFIDAKIKHQIEAWCGKDVHLVLKQLQLMAFQMKNPHPEKVKVLLSSTLSQE